MIVITGAKGQLGRAVVRNLLLRVSADQIAVSVRDTGKASELAAQGVEIHVAGFADDSGFGIEFSKDRVLILSADKLGNEELLLQYTAIDAASTSAVRCVLHSSHIGARAGSPFKRADQHAGTEAHSRIAASPIHRCATPSMPKAASI